MANWRPPQNNIIKFNTDAQFDGETGKGFSGIVARNKLGVMVSGSTSKIYALSPLAAEAFAMREAVSLASNLNIDEVYFESDSLSLIHACKEKLQRGEINVIARDILEIKKVFTFCDFVWINRNGNSVADCIDCIAKLASRNLLPNNWISTPPSSLRSLLKKDYEN